MSFASNPAKASGPFRVAVLAFAMLGWAVGANAQTAWPEKLFNPTPATDDVVLPMPCGGAMVFRPVVVPGVKILDDYQVQLGDSDKEYAFSEYRHSEYLSAPFADKSQGRYFLIAKYETTDLQYNTMTDPNCPEATLIGRRPVVEKTWLEAMEFAEKYSTWLIKNAARSLPSAGSSTAFLRLPTETEWEYAARGGVAVSPSEFEERTFPMPEGMEKYVWFSGSGSSNGKLQLTGLLKPNPLGLYDMLGNADEFTIDLFRLNRVTRMLGRPGGYIIKGGNYLTSMDAIRSSSRSEFQPYSEQGPRRSKTTGFRLVVSAAALNNQDDIAEARAEWDRLGSANAASSTAAASDDPVKEIQSLTELADAGSAMKERLERLAAKVKADILELEDQKQRSARTMLRLGAWLAAKLQQDVHAVALDKSNLDKGLFDEKFSAQIRDRIEKDEETIRKNMNFYSDLVIRVSDDFDPALLDEGGAVLVTELQAAQVSYLIDFVDLFRKHVDDFTKKHIVEQDAWLADFAASDGK
ncbi:hypothetical protein FRZ44_01200 [Hypericibacter terrae]|uniref:Sulfatase-modifying factor enzyme-like domain-containing protein n=1 Tax=Hypericibacter terrae TaxID=2602015 RepID=A0A5J6MEN6_9PROT|nr:SUMF1/EgtB/PvdO family nonheme iron enzyme [Hypericibacter terrae]QEX14845.1 hypothetical protein FRZ44_01200 [Hypericibacter terrae]